MLERVAAALRISKRTLALGLALLLLWYFVPELYDFTRGFFDGLS
jgi:hypothetical protein